jgi:SWI/SNF-related matrix-associated actin-dependent regulator of chromatin subfamily A protein 2/4
MTGGQMPSSGPIGTQMSGNNPMGNQMSGNSTMPSGGPMSNKMRGGPMGISGGPMGSGVMSDGMKPSGFSSPQLQQLRAQIMAYKMLARSQPLTDHIRLAIEGKRPFAPGYARPGNYYFV